MAEDQVAAAVASKLLGELRIGARVETYLGKRGTVINIRDGGRWKWVRVKFDSTGGHWEYTDHDLIVIG